MLIRPQTTVTVEIMLGDKSLSFETHVLNCDDQTISVSAPLFEKKRVVANPGTQVLLIFREEDGLKIVDTTVLRVERNHPVRWILKMPGIEGFRKINRRQDPRYELNVRLPWIPPDEYHLKDGNLLLVVNMSVSGAQVSLDCDLQLGDEIGIDLTPLARVSGEKIDHKVFITARVVRVAKEGERTYGVRFQTLSSSEKSMLAKALLRLKSKVV